MSQALETLDLAYFYVESSYAYFFCKHGKNKMELMLDLKKCRIVYMREDGNHQVLEIKEIEPCLNESGEKIEIVYLQDKGKKE